MSISGRCRFVVGTVNGKSVSYIVDQPIEPAPSYVDRPLTSKASASKESYAQPNRPSSTSASIGGTAEHEEPNEAKINASATLNNQQLDELMDILQRHHSELLHVCCVYVCARFGPNACYLDII
jgi:hypothetical protein